MYEIRGNKGNPLLLLFIQKIYDYFFEHTFLWETFFLFWILLVAVVQILDIWTTFIFSAFCHICLHCNIYLFLIFVLVSGIHILSYIVCFILSIKHFFFLCLILGLLLLFVSFRLYLSMERWCSRSCTIHAVKLKIILFFFLVLSD